MSDRVNDEPTDLYTSFTVSSAVQTLLKALDNIHIVEADLELLRPPADNAIIAVPKLGLVARIGVSSAHLQRLERELNLAHWLHDRAIPAIRPARETPTPQLTIVGERVITWWEILPSTNRGTLAELGRLLAQLHSQPKPWPALAALYPWARVDEQLAAAMGLPEADRRLLRRHWHELQARWNGSRWPREPSVVIHGDAYTGNTLHYKGTTYLLDFEDARIGPRQWDAASIAGFLELGWITDEQYASFCDAYGTDVRDESESEVLVDIVLFRRTCWYASRTGREPGVVDAVRHRVETLVNPSLAKQWLPGA